VPFLTIRVLKKLRVHLHLTGLLIGLMTFKTHLRLTSKYSIESLAILVFQSVVKKILGIPVLSSLTKHLGQPPLSTRTTLA
jgi:hypothetical protein